MSKGPELTVRIASEEDAKALSVFMQAQGQPRSSEAYLRHWYFHAPVPGSAVAVGEQDGTVVGMATMTMHLFRRAGKEARVAMPQKVLTDATLRGQGVFGKVYRASEQACLDRGADFFLTVTNAASTPIFLGKFGYQRAAVPRMAALLPLPGRTKATPITRADLAGHVAPAGSRWHMHKDAAHLQWRYIDHPLREYTCVQCGELGLLFVKRTQKKSVPVLLVLDLVPTRPEHAAALLREARKLAWRQRCMSVLVLLDDVVRVEGNGPVVRLSSGFNLLVKGRDEAHTNELAAQGSGLAFGDLDFL